MKSLFRREDKSTVSAETKSASNGLAQMSEGIDLPPPPSYSASSAVPELRAHNATFALFPTLVTASPLTTTMRVGATFTLNAASGNVVFSPDTLLLQTQRDISGRHGKAVFTPDGQHLFTVRKETHSFQPSRHYIVTPSGLEVFEMEFKAGWASSNTAVGRFTNAISGASEEVFLKGAWTGRTAEIRKGAEEQQGMLLARVDKGHSIRRPESTIHIERDVDYALVFAMLIMLHVREESHST